MSEMQMLQAAKVGVLETTDGMEWVAMEFPHPVTSVAMPPAFAVVMAQSLLKNARLAGYAEPFVEMPLAEHGSLN